MSWGQIEERWPDPRERDVMVAYSYQIGEDAFLTPIREDDIVITTYQNHCCDPNTWWIDDFTLVARRNISIGEEVTFDYSTCESMPNPEMPECRCGAELCRGRLNPEDYLNPELIERYGDHFVSYLRDRQRNRKNEESNAKTVAELVAAESTNDNTINDDVQRKEADLGDVSESDVLDSYSQYVRKS